jgi:hypothetical protein
VLRTVDTTTTTFAALRTTLRAILRIFEAEGAMNILLSTEGIRRGQMTALACGQYSGGFCATTKKPRWAGLKDGEELLFSSARQIL